MFNFAEKLKKGLEKTRTALDEIFYMGAEVDDDFWDDLEDRLVMGDCGAELAASISDDLHEIAAQNGYTYAKQIKQALAERLAKEFYPKTHDPFEEVPSCVVFVGINGAGKTTTVGKLAARAHDAGRTCLIGSADTFRAAAIEQLDVWAQEAGVEVVSKTRGADPASVCFEALVRAEEACADLVLIDTAGRLHTSKDLMNELVKVVTTCRKRSSMPVSVILVIDATCGQNGLVQAKEFNRALDLDGIILTKLDGTSKGGIAVSISHELKLPIYRVGVGEGLGDLDSFDPLDFACALVGAEKGDSRV